MSFPARWSGTHALLRLIMASLICGVSIPMIDAQLYVNDFMYGICNPADYASNSSFARNGLDELLSSFPQKAEYLLYDAATTSTSDPSSNSSTNVYAMYQCRGDISFSDCVECVSTIISLALCPASVGTSIQLRGCYFRMESYNFTQRAEYTSIKTNCSSSQDPGSRYEENLATAMNATAREAAKSRTLFSSSNSSSSDSSSTAYAIAQCVGYLTASQCVTCLSQGLSNRTRLCNHSVSGQLYFVTCYYLFDNTPLTPLLHKPDKPTPSPSPTTSNLPAPFRSIPTDDSKMKHSSKISIIVGLGSLLGFFLFLSTSGAIFVYKKKRSNFKRQMSDGHSLPANLQQGLPAMFSFKALRKATKNFDPINKLGEGGFGPVYKGKLKCGREVAVKMLSSGSRQGKREFMNEVELITSVQHRNLIQLLGCCVKGSKRLLVYEYLPHGSLDLLLFGAMEMDNRHSIAMLDWPTRFEIIVGVARGLCYLHIDSHVRIVHRDIKASNILLDHNMNPKIADFGLAKFFDDNVTHITTRIAGTIGYLAPEYAINGQLTEKADVYSFGLVALEIVSGRRVIDHKLASEKQHLLEWAWILYERQQQFLLVDSRVSNTIEIVGEVMKVVHVALLCTQTRAQLRPSMSQVCTMLCGQTEILTQPMKPTLISLNPTLDFTTIASASSFQRELKPSLSKGGSHKNPCSFDTEPC